MHHHRDWPAPGVSLFGYSTEALEFVPDFVRGAENTHPVGIADAERVFHILTIGKTGSGKSTVLLSLMQQDLERGHGFAVLDPHGDLGQAVLDLVPHHRVKDVIYLNPADLEFPIPFNVLADVPQDQHHLVVEGLVSSFERHWPLMWGPRSAYVLTNAAAALIERRGATLLDVARLFRDAAFRDEVLRHVTNPGAASFWLDEFARLSAHEREEIVLPLQNKVGAFAASPVVRNVIGQPRNLFDLRRVMDEGKIIVANLAKGALGEQATGLLGSLFLNRLMLAAFSRQDVAERARRVFHLYVDEFLTFADAETMRTLLSESRKYGLALTLATQHLTDPAFEAVRGAIFGNVGSLIAFRTSYEDARYLEGELAPYTASQLTSLERHQVCAKVSIGGVSSSPFSAITALPAPVVCSYRAEIIRRSRERYARPRAGVEQDIRRRLLPAALPMAALRPSRRRERRRSGPAR